MANCNSYLSRKMIKFFPFVVILSGLAVLIISIGDILLNVEKNGCVMTWMYQYPKYIKVPLSQSVYKKFPKYNLYLYGEGRYAQYLYDMQDNIQLTGIPVIFVHGNAGRFKQVRSPGSISLTKSEKKAYRFNYFSVDYEEELSALHGPFLERQTQFLLHSIDRIFKCYRNTGNKPKSIIAIGHSIGGIVIRGLLALPTFDANKISTVIALATPQTQPPVCLDQYIDEYYKKINRVWTRESRKKFDNVTFLSLGGSFRDHLVRSDLCLLDKISTDRDHLSGLTTSLPRIWLSNDHQCIVWCNQLVRALTRSFFNMIDPSTQQITRNHEQRLKILLQTMYYKNLEAKKLDRKDLSRCKDLDFQEILVDTIGCYKFIKNDFENIEIWAKTERLHTLYECASGNRCFSVDYRHHLPGSTPSQFHELDSQHASTYVIDAKTRELFYLIRYKQNTRNTNTITLPIMSQAWKLFGTDNKQFHTVLHLTGFYSPFQSYNIEISSEGAKHFDHEVVIQMRYAKDSNKSGSVFWFEPNQPVKVHLKTFTVPTNNKVEVHIFSKIDLSSGSHIVVTPNIVSILGQLMRFQMEDCLRYSLVLHVACFALKGRLRIFVQIHLVLKALLSVPTVLSSSLTAFVYNVAAPELFMLTVAFIMCKLISWMAEIIFLLVRALLFVSRKFLRLVKLQFLHVESLLLKTTLQLALAVLLLWLYLNVGVAFVLITLLWVHVLQINLSGDSELIRRSSWEYFVCYLPIIIVFTVAPTLVTVKDWLQNFDVTPSRFTNLEILTVMYSVQLLLRNDSRLPSEEMKKNLKFVIVASVLISAFMFKEFVKFYDITYLVVLGILFNICSPVLTKKMKFE